jgi:hypothetical protein
MKADVNISNWLNLTVQPDNSDASTRNTTALNMMGLITKSSSLTFR